MILNKTIKDCINELEHYYEFTRGAGHTLAMLSGGGTSDCLILYDKKSSFKLITKDHKKKSITITQVANGRLRGCNKPLLIDNSAIVEILSAAKWNSFLSGKDRKI